MLAISRMFEPMDLMDLEFERVMRKIWNQPEVEMPSALAPYAVNIDEDPDRYYVEAELPGFTRDEVEVTLEDNILTIRANRKEEKKIKDREPLQTEGRWAQFLRSFTLPVSVKEEPVKAEMEDGILKITLEKREESKPHKILIHPAPVKEEPVKAKKD